MHSKTAMAFTPISTTPKLNATTSISAILIVRNEEGMLMNCLETLNWVQEIVVLDTGSSDHTLEIAKRAGAITGEAKGRNFAEWRNEAAALAHGTWLLYIDADERVTPDLARVILGRVQREDYDAYRIRRNNIMMGKWFQFGGWQNDILLRLIRKSKLKAWVGEVHEHAEVIGRVGDIEEPLVHLTHRNLYDGLHKSIEWTDIEARLLFETGHPAITPLRLVKIVVFDFINRFLFKKAAKDGQEGSIEAMVQSMNRFLVYVRLWELQQKPSLPERYDRIELEIQKQWKKS